MDIFILRHGKAEKTAAVRADKERRLTPEGRGSIERVLDRARAAGMRPSLILSSPYRRAIETAQIAVERLRYDGLIARSETLTPDASPYDAWEEIRLRHEEEAILLATHEPLASSMAAFLLNSPALQIDVKTGSLIALQCSRFSAQPHCVLKWMITPAISTE